MATGGPVDIPFPLTTFPGSNPQESGGRLINVTAEPIGEASRPTAAAPQAWIRQPGLSQHNAVPTGQTGYRGGLLVNNLSFECWLNNASTIDVAGAYVSLGNFPGSKKISIARNQAAAPDVVAVDLDNGAYALTVAGVPAAPVLYNGGGVLPQPKAVCFQDGYFFYLIADCRIFASALNALGAINSQTFIKMTAKSDVVGQRVIAYSGVLWGFTTGHCEIFQDTAAPSPAFPYTRLLVLESGLIQENAIAGWDTGFSELIWVAQDFGVYWCTAGSFQPIKISPPDLDELIEARVRAGDLLDASCYAEGGKKFWAISGSTFSWEFNISTKKWNERSSFSGGTYGRWRATGGHPAFNKWLMGDTQSGNLLYPDRINYTENGAVQLWRIESGPVRNFPAWLRIARADFDFVMGTGRNVQNVVANVSGAVAGTGGVVRLTVNSTAQMTTNDTANVIGIVGTVEANVSALITVVDATHLELQGVPFVHAYVSGGTVTDVTAPPNVISPSVSITCSLDGGLSWQNPRIRQLGQQGKAKRQRASVKNMGLAGPMGTRWRLDVTDAVYVSMFGGKQSSNMMEVGA